MMAPRDVERKSLTHFLVAHMKVMLVSPSQRNDAKKLPMIFATK